MCENSLKEQHASVDAGVAERPAVAAIIRQIAVCAVLALGTVQTMAAESTTQAVAEEPLSAAAVVPVAVTAEDPAAADSQPPAQTQPTSEPQTISAILAETDAELEQIEAQIEAGEYDTSKVWLEARIATIEKASHRFDPDLVRPITLLGDVLVGQGNLAGALDSYGWAVHVQRVSTGLVSAGQIEIVYREAEVYRTLGNWEEANKREEYAYHVLTSAFDPYDEALLPGVFHLADWYRRVHNVFSARVLYEHAVDIYSAHGKAGSLEAIPALEGVADTYRLERFPPFYISDSPNATYGSSLGRNKHFDVPVTVNNFPAGERALQSIIRIRQENQQSAEQVAESVLELADWYTLFEKTRRAHPLYQHAYEILAADPDFDVVSYFAQPKLLHYPAPADPSPPPLAQRGKEALGYVQLACEVTPRGQVRSLKTIASEPAGLMDFRVRKSFRASRYRPALVDGLPMATLDYSYRHEFPYFPTLDTQLAAGQSDE